MGGIDPYGTRIALVCLQTRDLQQRIARSRDGEVVVAVTLWAQLYGYSTCQVTIYPEISNDEVNWERQTADMIGPLQTPTTVIRKLSKIGRFLRFMYHYEYPSPFPPPEPPPPQTTNVGGNVSILAIMRASDEVLVSPSPDDLIGYLNAIRRGYTAFPPIGSGRLIPFLPLDTLLTSDDSSGMTRTFYTQAQPTHEFRQLVASLEVRSFENSNRGAGGTSTMQVWPEISVDKVNWVRITSPSFFPVSSGFADPIYEVISLTTIAAWMRFAIEVTDDMGTGGSESALLSVLGIGL